METKKILFLLTGGVAVAWGAAYAFSKWNEQAFHSMSDRGTFGDSFGAFNAVVGGLGFAAVAYSLYRQQKQITDDKVERREQADQVRSQVAAMHAQAAAMTKLAEAMTADAERSRLLTEYDVIDRRIAIFYNEVPEIYKNSDTPELLQRFTHSELMQRRKEVEGDADSLRLNGRHIDANSCDAFALLLGEIATLRQRRRDLYLVLSGQNPESAFESME